MIISGAHTRNAASPHGAQISAGAEPQHRAVHPWMFVDRHGIRDRGGNGRGSPGPCEVGKWMKCFIEQSS